MTEIDQIPSDVSDEAQLRAAELAAALEDAEPELRPELIFEAADKQGGMPVVVRKPGAKRLVLDGIDLGATNAASMIGSDRFGGGRWPAWYDRASESVRLSGLDLSSSSLRGACFAGTDLRGARFAEAILRGAEFQGAKAEEASFRAADLIGADFRDAQAGEADFSECMLEDARFARAFLRFTRFDGSTLDNADFAEADLWGASFVDVEASEVKFGKAHLEEAKLRGARMEEADLSAAVLKKVDFRGAKLKGSSFADAVLSGADLSDADLRDTRLAGVSLASCKLEHVWLSGAWLERTRFRADQLGGMIGEEKAGDYAAAQDGYLALERNFRTLGDSDAASWAYRRSRRMGKLRARQLAAQTWKTGAYRDSARRGLSYAADVFVEWLCDYGESIGRVLRAMVCLCLLFTGIYWATGALVRNVDTPNGPKQVVVDSFQEIFSFSLLTLTETGPPDIIPVAGPWVYLVGGLEGAMGMALIGLFGFVAGNRIRR